MKIIIIISIVVVLLLLIDIFIKNREKKRYRYIKKLVEHKRQGCMISIVLLAVMVLLTIQGCAYLGKDYKLDDAKAKASEVSKDFSFVEEKVIKKSDIFSYATVNEIYWTFHDNDYDFDFKVYQIWSFPTGLPPSRVLRTNYYPIMFDALVFSRPQVRAILTPMGTAKANYKCYCRSKEQLLKNLDILENAVDEVKEETGVVAFGDYPLYDEVYIQFENVEADNSMYLTFDEREIEREMFITHLFPDDDSGVKEF